MDSNKNRPLSEKERIVLRRRLMESATNLNIKRKRKNKYPLLVVAASLALIVGIYLFRLQPKEQSLQDFVDSTSKVDINTTDKVTVVLGEGENIALEENSTVEYSANGTNVAMGKGKSYEQQTVVGKKPIYNTILVPYGKRTEVLLSDGTKVWINSDSKLIYPAIFNGKKREVYLEGEAIFDVAHKADQPFKVLSTNQEIEVLGTVFNVSHYPDEKQMNTVLKSGSIKITYDNDDSKSFKITPGTLSSYTLKTSKIDTRKVDVEDYFGWREGYLRLKQQRLDYIVSRLSRYYDVAIQIADENLAKETFSGKLDLKEDINKVIDIIAKTTKMKVTQEGSKIIITN